MIEEKPASEDSPLALRSADEWGNKLPFSGWYPIGFGALIGIAFRMVFAGEDGKAFSPMLGSFLFVVPFLVGAVTVYIAERQERRSWSYYWWAGWMANVFCVFGTLVIAVEGLICAIVIVPLVMLEGGIGGLVMGAVCRKTNWPKQTLYSLAALPLVLGSIEPYWPMPTQWNTVERRLVIDATPEEIWQQIMEARNIQPEEMQRAWMYRIGVPLPISGIVEQTPQGLVRRIQMGKNIHFDQVFTEWQQNRFVAWSYHFDDDSVPPAALDDHVKIGGHYFNLGTTSYTLNPSGAQTELLIRMEYRLTTRFNWYANPIAQQLFSNFEDVVLEFYQRRSEKKPALAVDASL